MSIIMSFPKFFTGTLKMKFSLWTGSREKCAPRIRIALWACQSRTSWERAQHRRPFSWMTKTLELHEYWLQYFKVAIGCMHALIGRLTDGKQKGVQDAFQCEGFCTDVWDLLGGQSLLDRLVGDTVPWRLRSAHFHRTVLYRILHQSFGQGHWIRVGLFRRVDLWGHIRLAVQLYRRSHRGIGRNIQARFAAAHG